MSTPIPSARVTQTGVSRRTVAKGAAWTVPAIVVGAAAPAQAISGTCASPCPTDLNFTGTGSNNVGTIYGTGSTGPSGCAPMGLSSSTGWFWGSSYNLGNCNYQTYNGYVAGPSNAIPHVAPYNYVSCPSPSGQVSSDGTKIQGRPLLWVQNDPAAGASFSIERLVCLTKGKTYQFCFRYALYNANPAPLQLAPMIYDTWNNTNMTPSTWTSVFQSPTGMNFTTGTVADGDISPTRDLTGTAGTTTFTLANGTTTNHGFFPGATYKCGPLIVGSWCQSFTPTITGIYTLRLMWFFPTAGTGGDGAWGEPTITCL